MKRSFALLAVLAVVACQPAAEAPPEVAAQASFTAEDEAAIRGMLEKYAVDVIAQDWESNNSYYDADAVRMPPNEPMMQGVTAIREWQDARPPVTGFTLTPQVIAGDGDMAYGRGAFTFDVAPPDGKPVSMVGKWHAIYERQADGSWLCVSDIWNTDAPVGM
jgi:ketosteroid isomerase-like protein